MMESERRVTDEGKMEKWHPQGDSNPCCRDENPVS